MVARVERFASKEMALMQRCREWKINNVNVLLIRTRKVIVWMFRIPETSKKENKKARKQETRTQKHEQRIIEKDMRKVTKRRENGASQCIFPLTGAENFTPREWNSRGPGPRVKFSWSERLCEGFRARPRETARPEKPKTWVKSVASGSPSALKMVLKIEKWRKKWHRKIDAGKVLKNDAKLIVKWCQNWSIIDLRFDAIRERVILRKPCFYYNKSMFLKV